MKLTGILLQKGEQLPSGDIIDKDCKINLDRAFSTPVTWNCDHSKPIGTLLSLELDEKKSQLVGEIQLNEEDVSKLNIFKRFINYFIDLFGFPPVFKVHKDVFKQYLKRNSSFGYSGVVKEREGNQITKFDLKEVSLISKK